MKIINDDFEWEIYSAPPVDDLNPERISMLCRHETLGLLGLKFFGNTPLRDVLRAIMEHTEYASHMTKDQMWMPITDLKNGNGE